jgi:glycerate dehydrogenase
MHVLAYSRHKKEGAAYDFIEQVSLDELLARSDFISLHTPHTPATEHMIDQNTIARMKDGVILINTARGALIDEQALADALATGKVLAAGLDVLTDEPPVHGSPLLTAPNTVITGHIAWLTRESRIRAIDMAIDNFRCYLEGHPVSIIN